jgi:hypothetical protein
MAANTMPEATQAIQNLMRERDLLLLLTGPDGTQHIEDDHLNRRLGYCLELNAGALKTLALRATVREI